MGRTKGLTFSRVFPKGCYDLKQGSDIYPDPSWLPLKSMKSMVCYHSMFPKNYCNPTVDGVSIRRKRTS